MSLESSLFRKVGEVGMKYRAGGIEKTTIQDMNVIFNEVRTSDCQLVRTGQARCKGKASIEWYTEDSRPMYYCLGYTDKMTDELLPECNRCSKHVYKAQRDLEAYLKGR